MNNFLNYILAPQCIFCGRVFSDFCIKCLSSCSFIEKPICIECKNFSPFGITHSSCLKKNSPTVLYSLFSYEHYVSECIKRSKYFRKEFAALRNLTEFGVAVCIEDLFLLEDFNIITVPLSKQRLKERGFNQSDFIAKELAKKVNVKQIACCIKRKRHTEAQYTKDKISRRKNLLGAFEVTKDVKGKKLLVVDDIFTTGSTMLEISKILYNAGAIEVRCFALSRVL